MPFIYSKLSADTAYTAYTNPTGDLPSPGRVVLVKGGAGVADKRSDTVQGVVTEVSDDDLMFLRKQEVFQRHETNGFVMVSDKLMDVEKAVADMDSDRDPSGPLVPQDFDDAGDNGKARPTLKRK